MRAFALFLGLIVFGFVAMAVFSYPAWLLLHPHFDFPFHRIWSRIGYLWLLVTIWPLLRYLRLNNRESLGYGLPRRAFLREVGIAFGLGLATMLPVVLIMGALGLIEIKAGLSLDAVGWAKLALQGALTGIFVSLGEETFTRGAMYSAIARESGPAKAIVLTALIYASLHFIGKAHIPADQVGPGSGFDLIAISLRSFAYPLGIVDAFLCLLAVGTLLGLVRRLAGNIAPCIGLHAGWVFVITFLRNTTDPVRANPLEWLLSNFDGVVGWLVLAWTAVISFFIYRFYSGRSARQLR
jgi:membrane protease YdiL (CAAX protease family)